MTTTGADSLRVRELAHADVARWNAFVDARPDATFFHRAEWHEVIRRAFGHRHHYCFAEDASGAIRGVLPLVRVKSWLFGDTLASIPFGVYGGVAAADDEARALLEGHACALAQSLRVDALEMRNTVQRHADWPTKRLYHTFRKTIDPDPEVNLKAIPRKQRAMVRKGIDAGLTSELTQDPDRLFPVYAESVRNLGTPVFPRRYFRILQEVFGDACDILVARHGGEDVAAVMSFYFRDEVLPFYGGSRPVAREVKGNDFMYWELMRRSAERGIRVFDYGRSKEGSGSFSFKKNWGFEPQPLYYEYFLVRSQQVPEVNPANPKYRLFIEAWKRLPLPLASLVGARLSPFLG
jgi:FemAB-related protein (PEP-CTERM system-associated)